MAKKSKKLNSMRLLEANNIGYEVLEYDPVTRDASEVAEMIGAPEFIVYKTLIAQPAGGGDAVIAMLAADRQLDLKRLASAAGEKKMKLAPHADAEKMTGLQVGGISPLMLMDKNWPVYLDQPAADLQHIIISAGQRGLQLRVAVTPLMTVLRARLAEIGTDES